MQGYEDLIVYYTVHNNMTTNTTILNKANTQMINENLMGNSKKANKRQMSKSTALHKKQMEIKKQQKSNDKQNNTLYTNDDFYWQIHKLQSVSYTRVYPSAHCPHPL